MWIEELTSKNPCPQAWQDKGENGYPKSEMGYFRCDYDGYKWWNTVWPVNRELETPELIREFDSLYDSFRQVFPSREAWNTVWPVNRELETPELIREFDSLYDSFRQVFPSREAMTIYCRSHAEPTSDSTEYNAYLELEHGFYWFRMITRKGDYNLYLHCISKAALAASGKPDTEDE